MSNKLRNVLYQIKLRGYREYCRDEATWTNIFTSKKVMIKWVNELVKYQELYDGQIVMLEVFIQKYIRDSSDLCYVTNQHVDLDFTVELDYLNSEVRKKHSIISALTTRLKDI